MFQKKIHLGKGGLKGSSKLGKERPGVTVKRKEDEVREKLERVEGKREKKKGAERGARGVSGLLVSPKVSIHPREFTKGRDCRKNGREKESEEEQEKCGNE